MPKTNNKVPRNRRFPSIEEIDAAISNETQPMRSEDLKTDPLREDFERKYGKMTDQEFFEAKQNLFGFFSLLDDISQELEAKKAKENGIAENI
jgi:hypothetical protein